MAAIVGVRAGNCMMAVPARILVVFARIHALVDIASEPQASADQAVVKPSSSPCLMRSIGMESSRPEYPISIPSFMAGAAYTRYNDVQMNAQGTDALEPRVFVVDAAGERGDRDLRLWAALVAACGGIWLFSVGEGMVASSFALAGVAFAMIWTMGWLRGRVEHGDHGGGLDVEDARWREPARALGDIDVAQVSRGAVAKRADARSSASAPIREWPTHRRARPGAVHQQRAIAAGADLEDGGR